MNKILLTLLFMMIPAVGFSQVIIKEGKIDPGTLGGVAIVTNDQKRVLCTFTNINLRVNGKQAPATFLLKYKGYTLDKCNITNGSLPGNDIEVTVKGGVKDDPVEIEFYACFVKGMEKATLRFNYLEKGYLKYRCEYIE